MNYKKCLKCGTNNERNARFCRKCGEPFHDTNTNPRENELIKEKNNLLIALTKLKNIAYRDHLTGLLNRRSMLSG